MPRNSESQTRGAHRRHHVNRGIIRSSCELCRADHPELGGDVELQPEQTKVEILRKDNASPIDGATIIAYPVVKAPDPSDSLDESLERDRLYRWAALKRTIQEVATATGSTVEALTEKIQTGFGVSWESLSERAFLEVQFEVLSNIYARAQGGDARFVLLFTKMLSMPEFRETAGNQRLLPPPSIKSDIDNLSDDARKALAEKYAYVIYRPDRFKEPGPITPTCYVRDQRPEDRPQTKEIPVPRSEEARPRNPYDFRGSQMNKPDSETVEPQEPETS